MRNFSATNGRLTSIATGGSGQVQNVTYTYDLLGNPLSRTDGNTSLSETFAYDGLNRLTTASVNLSPTPVVKSFSYSPIGNLLSKSDVGTYSYPSAGSARPHAVASISGGAITTSFTYDANGNQTSGLGRSIVYSSFDTPSSITQGARTISFLNDIDNQRFKQVTPEGSTLYISAFGVLAELSNPGASGERRTEYLSAGDSQIGMRVIQTAPETVITRYFHADHLGSVSVITNEAGAIVERPSYDQWGKRRHPDGTDDATGSITSESTRGFTGEEHLSVAGLIHLNGRIYDPLLARMTSADPFVDGPLNSQGWNRYSYVGNRPLAFTDPTGFESWQGCECPSWYVPPSFQPSPVFEHHYPAPFPQPIGSGWSWTPTPNPAPTPFPQLLNTPPPIVQPLWTPPPPENMFGPAWQQQQQQISEAALLASVVNSQPPRSSAPTVTPTIPTPASVSPEPAVPGVGPSQSGAGSQPVQYAWMNEMMRNRFTRSPIDYGGGGGGVGVRGSGAGAKPALPKSSPGPTFNDLLRNAQKLYPGKAGKIEHHHVVPKYLGGPRNGRTVPLDGSYHQQITNEFRRQWPYGGRAPNPQELEEIMRRVYKEYPVP